MASKSRNPKPQSNHTNEPREGGARLLIALTVGIVAAIYLGWFLSYPVLAGMPGPDGEPMSRLLFLSRIMLPDMWWLEMTGGGRLPLGFLDRIQNRSVVSLLVWT